jgi:hypothetical protein
MSRAARGRVMRAVSVVCLIADMVNVLTVFRGSPAGDIRRRAAFA